MATQTKLGLIELADRRVGVLFGHDVMLPVAIDASRAGTGSQSRHLSMQARFVLLYRRPMATAAIGLLVARLVGKALNGGMAFLARNAFMYRSRQFRLAAGGMASGAIDLGTARFLAMERDLGELVRLVVAVRAECFGILVRRRTSQGMAVFAGNVLVDRRNDGDLMTIGAFCRKGGTDHAPKQKDRAR